MDIFERKRFEKKELLELIKQLDSEAKITEITDDKTPSPFLKINFYRAFEISFKYDNYIFNGIIYKLDIKDEKSYCIVLTAREKITNIEEYYLLSESNKKQIADVTLLVDFEEYYFDNINEKEKGFYTEREYNFDYKVIANFKNKKLYYCNKEIVAFLITSKKDFIGIKENNIKEFLNRNEFYLKTKDNKIFYIEKMDTNIIVDKEFLEEQNIDYEGIFYRCDCLNENEKSKIITEEKIDNFFDIDILFIREKEDRFISKNEWIS